MEEKYDISLIGFWEHLTPENILISEGNATPRLFSFVKSSPIFNQHYNFVEKTHLAATQSQLDIIKLLNVRVSSCLSYQEREDIICNINRKEEINKKIENILDFIEEI